MDIEENQSNRAVDLLAENKQQAERIKDLKAENKQIRSIKCPPISDGDSCICPIEELETELSRIKYHTKNALHYYKANKPKEMMGAFEHALKG